MRGQVQHQRRDRREPGVGRLAIGALDLGDARALGVTKTPEFFVNGRPMPSFGLEELQGLVREELRDAKP